jgi:flagellar biosynthetic protein FliR
MIEMMSLLHQFLWPFVRVSAMLLTAPIFGTTALNLRTRVAIGAVLTLLIFQQVDVPDIDPFSFPALTKMFHEVVVGGLMGLTLQIVSAAVILSGQMVSNGMGLGMANMIDPNLGNVPTLSNFFLVIALLAFLSLGGHLVLISVLVDSYSAVPIGNGMLSLVSIEGFLGWTSQMFIGAVTLVLPVLVALLMINVSLGVISRASPSLNIFAVGFPALIPVGLVLVTLTLTFYYTRLETLWYDSFRFLQQSLF